MKRLFLAIAFLQIAALFTVNSSCHKNDSTPIIDTTPVINDVYEHYYGHMVATVSSAGNGYADSAFVVVTTDSIKTDSVNITFPNLIYTGSQTLSCYLHSSNQDSTVYYLMWVPGGGTLVKYHSPKKIKLHMVEYSGPVIVSSWNFSGNIQ